MCYFSKNNLPTTFRFLEAFFFSYLDLILILFRHLLKLIKLGNFNIILRRVITRRERLNKIGGGGFPKSSASGGVNGAPAS